MANITVTRKVEEAQGIWMLGGLYHVLAAGDETDGAATIMEMTLPAGMGPPPHTHPGGEAVFVLEGKLRYHIADDVVEGGPGSFFYVPAGTTENFEPLEQSRILVIYTPGGIDRFFAEAGEPAERNELPPPPSSPPDLERLIEIGARYGMEIQAPAAA
jgi:quercetin dioxygenase-like cupin family protein